MTDKKKTETKIYGILIKNKDCINCLGLFKTKEKARESWEALSKFTHTAVMFEYKLEPGKGKELAGMNQVPKSLRFFKKLTTETKLKVT